MGSGIKEISKPGCGIKMQGQHWDKPKEGAMQDRTARCKMISESQNFNIHKATRLLLLKCKFWSLCSRIRLVIHSNVKPCTYVVHYLKYCDVLEQRAL